MDQALFLSVQAFTLAFVRVAGILGAGPFFGGRNVPTMFKAGVCFFITLLVLPSLHLSASQIPSSVLGLMLTVLREVAVGLAVGLMAQCVFSAIQMAGELLGVQMGFSMMNLLDPSTGASVPVISELYSLFAMLAFFLLDAHHLFVRGVFESFQLAPLGSTVLNPAVVATLAAAVGKIFVMALELAGPVMAALFLADVALGLVARTLPQMNIFNVGFPIKIVLGLVTLAATLPILMSVLSKQFSSMEPAIRQLLHGM